MKIGFIGLGKLGMPLAVAIASKKIKTIGYDSNESVMNFDYYKYQEAGINNQTFDECFQQAINEKTLVFSKNIEEIVENTELIFLCIQTPHEKQYEGITRAPKKRSNFDYKYLIESIKQLNLLVKKI